MPYPCSKRYLFKLGSSVKEVMYLNKKNALIVKFLIGLALGAVAVSTIFLLK